MRACGVVQNRLVKFAEQIAHGFGDAGTSQASPPALYCGREAYHISENRGEGRVVKFTR